MFQAALAHQGLAPARVAAWVDVIAHGLEVRPGEIVRLDSPGEDALVERALLRRGEAAVASTDATRISARELEAMPAELGRILAPRQHHLGLLVVLDELERAVVGARVMQPIPAIRELFDKRIATPRWRAVGIPVPESFEVTSVAELRELSGTVYVKLSCGSSASCVAIWDGTTCVTTVEDTGRARYNTRRLQRLTGARADRVLAFLLAEGSVVERAIDKLQLDGRHCDLRVLAVGGATPFVVARTSPHPITNLHLGGTRGDVDAVRARAADWDAVMATCVAVQRASGAFHVGVDVAIDVHGGHHVLEGNAFGDLLPNLVHDGLDTYGWEIRRYLASGS